MKTKYHVSEIFRNHEKRLQRLERYYLDQRLNKPTPSDSDKISVKENFLKENSKASDSLLPPTELLLDFIHAARALPYIQIKPHLPKGRWNLGCSCIKGNVRPYNQDYGLGFEIAKHQILIIADGCGGVPHGDIASFWAAKYAAQSIIKTYASNMQIFSLDPSLVAKVAMRDAYLKLSRKAWEYRIKSSAQGLCTTLIILIGAAEKYGYAYIGDGGGMILRPPQSISFLKPQKMAPNTPNILAGCLGPIMEGQPVFGSLPRQPEELAIIATDGVFDYVEESFFDQVLNGCHKYQGDLQYVTEQVLATLARRQDERGAYCCDDNMTLGLMGNKQNF